MHYTASQAKMLARRGIRVNCVAPGSIEFPGGSWERRRTENPELYASTLAQIPFGRMGRRRSPTWCYSQLPRARAGSLGRASSSTVASWSGRDVRLNRCAGDTGSDSERSFQRIARHYGLLLHLTDEGVDRPPTGLATALHAEGVDAARFVAARPGQVWTGEAAT